ncbi:hypothetical protein L226DRAFT_538472 [Lentinus tigrinus ALCF2SS1-7]|uniref:DUF6699 domain-containing protein n=1 Tax=Lentinus tigrinus ALCF2SS1-6 TaxID=1328759 RepID=A0A5C2S901_9APHY|nr:hypothetical protein L227DRAFT_575415 [Lentinus tigrinus ALCF2SS1-6]RPD70869.1 hypothetical protein L226DRAFT_538472 [Lentinus tigrinus ALCF2SS1-7]
MPAQKRVRFADLPQTPSPSWSSSSLGSSPGPFTPPQPFPAPVIPTVFRPPEIPAWQQRVPPFMPVVPSPPCFSALGLSNVEPERGPAIDPLLVVPHHHAHPPPLRWDVAEHPNYIQLGSVGSPGARDLSHSDLASCAVRKSANGSPMMLKRITLVFPGHPLIVEVLPEGRPLWTSTSLPYLTVGDVLYGLYRALRLSAGRREFDSLSRSRRESVSRAFERRLASDRRNYHENMRYGVRNVDYLGETRRFLGLRPAEGGEIPRGCRRGEVFVVELASVR